MKRSYMIRKAGFTFALRIVSLVLKIALLPIVIWKVGKDSYGVFVLMMSLAAQINVFEGGVGRFIILRMAGWHDGIPREEAERLISTTGLIMLGVTLGSCAGLALVLFTIFDPIFRIPEDTAADLAPAKILAILTFGMTFVGMFLNRLLAGLHAFEKTNIASAMLQIVVLFGVVLFVHRDAPAPDKITMLTGAYLAGQCAVCTVLALMWRGEARTPLRPSWRRVDRGLAGECLIYAWPFAATDFTHIATSRLDTWIAGAMFGPGPTAVLDVGKRIILAVEQLSSDLLTTVFPFASRLLQSSKETFGRLYSEGTYYIFAMTGLLAVGAAGIVRPVVSIVFGEDFAVVPMLVWVLLAGLTVSSVGECGNALLMSMGKFDRLLKYRIAGAIGSLTLQITLARVWGLPGLVIATVIATSLVTVGIVWESGKWIENVVAPTLRSLVRPAVFLTALLAVAFLLFPLQGIDAEAGMRGALLKIGFWSAALGAIGLAGFDLLILQSKDRILLRDIIRSTLRRKKPS